MRWLVIVLIGCGRIAFDPLSDFACEPAANVPTQLTMSGVTIEYMSFDNMSMPIANVRVDVIGPGVIASSTSDAGGNYAALVDNVSGPTLVRVEYTIPTHFTSVVTSDQPLDRNVMGAHLPVWTLGDGPIWRPPQMTGLYGLVGVARDTERGTLNIAVRDCADNPIEGVVVDISPAPQMAFYQAVDGSPGSGMSTVGPFAHVLAFNAIAGPTRITATKDGVTFVPMDVEVRGGDVNNLVVIHGAVR